MYIKFANELADASGEVIRKYFRKNFEVSSKSDDTPVTIADRKAEVVMRKLIESKFPSHGIIGEEFGEKKGRDYAWLLDPVDGTKSFIAGRPIFGTLIALIYKGRAVLGVIDQPITGERWTGDGKKASFGGKKITSSKKQLQDAVIATTSPDCFGKKEYQDFERICGYSASKPVFGGDCYNYALLASGHIDLVIEAGLKPYDYAALIPVIEGAGGVVSDWNGKKPDFKSKTNIIAAANKELWKEVIGKL